MDDTEAIELPPADASHADGHDDDHQQPARTFPATHTDDWHADPLADHALDASAAATFSTSSASASSTPGSSLSACCQRVGTSLRSHRHRYLVCLFFSFALSNLIIGAMGYEETCTGLAAYCIAIGVLCTWTLGALTINYLYCHGPARQHQRTTFLRSTCGRLLVGLFSLFGLALVVVSCGALARLAEDSCPYHRNVRQMVLADGMVVLTGGFAMGMYYFLRYHFPELRYSAITKQAGKTALLCLCLAAVVSCLVNLITHPFNGITIYHWGVSSRPTGACPTQCTSEWVPWTAEQYNATRRQVACFDSDGNQMADTSACQHLVPEQRPDPTSLAFAPCPELYCLQGAVSTDAQAANPFLPYWALSQDLSQYGAWRDTDSQGSLLPLLANCARRSSDSAWFTYALSCRSNSAFVDPSTPYWELCANATRPALLFGEGQSDVIIDSGSDHVSRWRSSSRELSRTVRLDQYASCQQRCLQLFVSAIVFASIFGIFSILLTISLLCARVKRTHPSGGHGATIPASDSPIGAAGPTHQSTMEQAVMADVDGASQPNAISSSVPLTVHAAVSEPGPDSPPVVGGSSVVVIPAMQLPAAPAEDAPIQVQLGYVMTQVIHLCATIAHLCHHLAAALRILVLVGTRGVRPYWRHLLLLVLCCLLVGLSIFSFINLLHLVNANCRDYIVSCVTTAVVTFLLTMVTLHAVIVHKDEMLQPERNPFEALNLLQPESDEDGDETLTGDGISQRTIATQAQLQAV